MKNLVWLFLFIVGFVSVSAQERYVKPVDEAAKDASFLAFRTKLIAAARRHDAKYILSIVDKDIKNSFGGNDGIEEFKKWWKPESATSKFWDEFLPVITNGGKFFKEPGGTSKLFTAPYSFDGFPDDLDAFTYSVIFGSNVNLRAKPDLKSEVLARLSYNIVKVDYQSSVADAKKDGEYEWLKVETLGGKTGFVHSKYVRSPIDYRAGFEKKNGKWKMIFFVAGD